MLFSNPKNFGEYDAPVPEVFKAFGDLPEGDEEAGVNASEWNAIRDAVKAEAKTCPQGDE